MEVDKNLNNHQKLMSFVVAVQSLSQVWLFVTPWTTACQASLSFTVSWVCWNSWRLSQWCHPTISSSVVPFSFCPQYLPASGAFPMSRLFASGGQSIGASGSVFPMNIQGCFPLGLTGWISLLSKELSRVFSSTTVQKHKFFGSQLLYGSALTSVHDYWKSYHVFSLLIWRPLDCLKL